MARKRNPPSFERALEEFEQLVARMEEGELTLEESLKTYERGMELSRACHKALEEAEQRIELLTAKDGKLEAIPFEPDED